MKLDKFYINGEWVSPVKDEKIDIINPSDESVIGKLNVGSQQDIDKAVEAAKAAFSSYARTSVAERLDLLKEIRNQFKDRFEDVKIHGESKCAWHVASGESLVIGVRVACEFSFLRR